MGALELAVVDFRPFRGIRYDVGPAGPMDRLVCPPYDVISEAEEQELLRRSDFNMVRLELAESSAPPEAQRYTDASRTYRRWLEQGVLRRDQEPGFYLLRQRFPSSGGVAERYSVTGALRLEKFGQGVLPHEHTAEGPKQDRLALMEACAANFSPVMGLYQDETHQVETVRNRAMARSPEVEFAGADGQGFTLWSITDGDSIEALQAALASRPVYLADGHHRYETALAYRELARRRSGDGSSNQAVDFIMASLIAFEDPGLLVLPYHRVVGELLPEALTQLLHRIRQLFTMQSASVNLRTAGPLEELVAQERRARLAMGLVGPGDEGPYLLSAGGPAVAQGTVPSEHEGAVHEVEAWTLEETLLRPVLGEGFADHVTYVPDAQQALDMVRERQGQLAFILPALPLELFQRVVSAGVRLPRKTTYFHPKLPSGLVINPLEGVL